MIKNHINKKTLYIIYFVFITIIGSIGFYIIGGNNWSLLDSIYMTIITLTFVGFSEVHPLSDLGRIWAMVVIVFGVVGLGMLFASMRDIIIYFNTYRRIIMGNKIKNFKDHFIICGYGRMGAVIAEELNQKNIKFIIIEKDSTKAEKIRELGMFCIHGDATIDETLEAASVDKAKGIAVVLNTDQDNLFVTMTLRSLNSKAFLLSRCANNQNKSKLLRSGANKVINPYVTGGHRIVEMLIRPEITDSVSLMSPNEQNIDLNIDQISVKRIPNYINKSIRDTDIRNRFNLMIIGIIKNNNNDNITNPPSDYIICKEDILLIIGDKEQIDKFGKYQLS